MSLCEVYYPLQALATLGVFAIMLSYWMAYLQYRLGAQPDAAGKLDGYSTWSAQLLGSTHWWMILEGTHILALTISTGILLFVDLRILGLILPATPISRVNRSLLPVSIGGFVVVFLTGLLLFYSKPFDYYHNIAFRLKLLFLVLAAINLAYFELRVRPNGTTWDAGGGVPKSVRRVAALSLLLWVLVIAAGRCMAYERYTCPNPSPTISALDDCAGRQATLDRIGKEVSL